MAIQRLQRFLPFVPGQRNARRFVASFVFLFLVIMSLPALSGAQQACQPDGDVDRNGSVTAADALLAFQQALGLTQLTACQRGIADVTPLPSAPDGNITASDALCIFQKALSLPSCLDTLPSTNQPPVADAGLEQFVFGNEVVMLTGSGSDTDGTVVRYRWMQTSGPTVVLSGADTPNASFTAPEVAFEDLVEELEFQLTVTDDDGASDTAVVLVVAIYDPGTNEPPTADAGFDQMVSENILVMLSGAASDSDGTVTDYFWLQISGVQVLLFDADTFNPSFTAPEVDSEAELVFELNVLDDELGFAMDTVTITVLNAVSNTPPVADAGRGQTVDENTLVTLSGSGSDADGMIVSYRWRQTSGTPVALSGASTRTASFTAPDVDADEELVFELTVTDDGGASDVDMVTVTVHAASASSALREMVFQNPSPGQPSYVIAGDNAGLQYWFTPSGDVSQALHEKADGTERIRTFYDEVTGAPRTVLDEISGHWLSIREAGPDRVDFWRYDGVGNYLDGFAIYETSGQYYTGEIVGVPAHEWQTITGQLIPDDASWIGSFTLTGDVEDGLTNIREAPPELVALIDELAIDDASDSNAIRPVSAGPSYHSVIVAQAASDQADEYEDEENDMVLAMLNQLGWPGAVFANLYKRAFKKDGLKERECLVHHPRTCAVFRYLADKNSPSPYDAIRSETPTPKTDGLRPEYRTASRAETTPASPISLPTEDGKVGGTATTGPDDTETRLMGTITPIRHLNAWGTHARGLLAISGNVGPDGSVDGSFSLDMDSGSVTPGPPLLDRFDTEDKPSISCSCQSALEPTNPTVTDTGDIQADCGPHARGEARCDTCDSDQSTSRGTTCSSEGSYPSMNLTVEPLAKLQFDVEGEAHRL